MKKILIFTLAALSFSGNAIAQKVTNRLELGYPDRAALSIPKEFTYNNTPLITLYDNTEERNLLVYDENLDLVKAINIKNDKTFDYQLTFQDETREVSAVTERDKVSYEQYPSFEYFLQATKNLEPTFDESQLTIVKQENGDSLITYDYSYSKWMTNEQMYFAYNYFGMQYPKVYWICSKGTVYGYRTGYSVTYTDWKVAGTHTENKQETLSRIRLCNVNLNQGDGRANYYFEASQTLFNEDEDFEYIIPKYKLSASGNVSGGGTIVVDPNYDESIVTNRTTVVSEENKLALAGFQIVSANGNVIKDVAFDNDFEGYIDLDYAFVITIGQTTYLAFNGNSNDESSTIFYKIDRATTDIKRIMKAPATMTLSPTVVNRNATINVSLGDDNKDGSEIVIVSAAGAMSKKVVMPAGQTSAQLSVSAPTGVYCVSRVQKNKVTDTQKIIIK